MHDVGYVMSEDLRWPAMGGENGDLVVGENADLVVGVFAVPSDVGYVMSEDLRWPAMGGENAYLVVCPAMWGM